VKGATVHLENEYLPNQVTMEEPGTIRYWYDSYTSGPLAIDEGTPNDPYGNWGVLDGAVACVLLVRAAVWRSSGVPRDGDGGRHFHGEVSLGFEWGFGERKKILKI